MRAKFTSICSVIVTAWFACHCSVFRATLPADYRADANQSPDERVELYWVGHATALIRIYDRWILTDPVWSTYLGPVKRYVAPSMPIESLPFVDFTLISHTHLDHLDRPTLQRIPGSRHILAPRGGVGYIPPERFAFVHGVSPGDVVADEELRVIVVPAQHFGGRYLIDNLWDGEPYQGYIVQYRDVTLYFAGDTGYNPRIFKALGEKYDIDIALIPVGPSGGPAWLRRNFGREVHVDPYEAITAFQETRARWMIPIHHSTFFRRGGSEMAMIQDAITKSALADRILLLGVGESVAFDLDTGKTQRAYLQEARRDEVRTTP